jgi:hypothetical protein
MRSGTHGAHQLTLLDAGLESPQRLGDKSSMCDPPPAAADSQPRRQRKRKPLGATQMLAPPPPHRAPRGDLFRELAEQSWAAPNNTTPTTEDIRAEAYRRLADSVGTSIYRRKKRLKGPIEKLRRAVGSNRFCEFAQWLQQIRSIKGASAPVRYYALLSLIERQIDGITIEFRYTYDDFDEAAFYTHMKHDLISARELVNKARLDTAELEPLLKAMAALYSSLRAAKRFVALPPQAPVKMTDEERRALLAGEAQRKAQEARVARVAESRQWLRDLAQLEKRSEYDVRCGGCWISMNSAVEMVHDDLRGYVGCKPLWTATPTIDQLAADYRMTKRDAGRVLAAAGENVNTQVHS